MHVRHHSKSDFLSFQCKRRFERDCKEADRAQQYFEKMDADINVTKADVEKVRVISHPSQNHQACQLVDTSLAFRPPFTLPIKSAFYFVLCCFLLGFFAFRSSWFLIPLNPKRQRKNWVTMCPMPGRLCKSLHCFHSTAVSVLIIKPDWQRRLLSACLCVRLCVFLLIHIRPLGVSWITGLLSTSTHVAIIWFSELVDQSPLGL